MEKFARIIDEISPPSNEVSSGVNSFEKILLPAVLVLLSACSEKVNTKDLGEAIKSGEHVEYLSSEKITHFKDGIQKLIEKNKEKGFISVGDENGEVVQIYFPNKNLLIVECPLFKESVKCRFNRSYSFESDGSIVFSQGSRFNTGSPYVNDRSIIQPHEEKYVLTFSQIYDFGPKRTYEIGRYKHNDAIKSSEIENYMEMDQRLMNTQNF